MVIDREDFIRFCESKGDESYRYFDNENCALAQYLKSKGLNVSVDGYAYHIRDEYGQLLSSYDIPDWLVNELTRYNTFAGLAEWLKDS